MCFSFFEGYRGGVSFDKFSFIQYIHVPYDIFITIFLVFFIGYDLPFINDDGGFLKWLTLYRWNKFLLKELLKLKLLNTANPFQSFFDKIILGNLTAHLSLSTSKLFYLKKNHSMNCFNFLDLLDITYDINSSSWLYTNLSSQQYFHKDFFDKLQ